MTKTATLEEYVIKDTLDLFIAIPKQGFLHVSDI